MMDERPHATAGSRKHRVVAADCVIVRDNKVLLQKRSFGMWKGYWCLVGGKVDIGETIIHAAVREVKEESGLDVSNIQVLGIYDGKDRDAEQNCVAVGFLCEANDAEPVMSAEATEMRFFPFTGLPEKIAFDHRLIIEDARKRLDLIASGGKAL
jgi:ADP-ribose pyrophosphatase YjhB (NUDIX family)